MMKAAVVHEPGGPEALKIEEVPIPAPVPGSSKSQPSLRPHERGVALGGLTSASRSGGFEEAALQP
jgi:hypothetical protein